MYLINFIYLPGAIMLLANCINVIYHAHMVQLQLERTRARLASLIEINQLLMSTVEPRLSPNYILNGLSHYSL